MTLKKHPGGRGRRAENKHETFSVSLPPHLKALLDSWVTPAVSRSEVIARLIQAQADASSTLQSKGMSTPQARLETPSRPSEEQITAPKLDSPKRPVSKRGKTERLASYAPVLHVMQRTMPRGQKWTPAKYLQAEALLAEGDTLQAQGVDFVTEKGNVMSWRTAEALVKLGVLVVPPAKM